MPQSRPATTVCQESRPDVFLPFQLRMRAMPPDGAAMSSLRWIEARRGGDTALRGLELTGALRDKHQVEG